ncbi:MAG: hypothetical protein KKH28_12820 [Elusimicrobia bacterium]|nr:hypothetical protein [Elusimicrobiota bacterium]
MNKLVFLLNILFLCGCVSSLSLQSKKDNKTEVGIEQNINNEEYIIYSRCINEDLLSYFKKEKEIKINEIFIKQRTADHIVADQKIEQIADYIERSKIKALELKVKLGPSG